MFSWYKRIVKLEEQVNSMVRFGTIKEILSGNLVIVDLGNNKESPKLPYLVNSSGNATVYFEPKIGDQVVVISKSGSLHQGLVIPSVYKGNVAGDSDEWRLEFAKGSIIYKAGKLEIKAEGEVSLDAPKVVISGESAGGVVGGKSICAFTGGPHPECSTKVFIGR